MLEALHHAAGDQAAGLRRLFRSRTPQVVAFVSGRESCGRTSLLVQTAAALGNAGHGVVIIDENSGSDNVFSTFGISSRHDLLDMVQGRRTAHQIMMPAAPLVRAVAASRFAGELHHLDPASASQLAGGLRQIQVDSSFVLIDCAVRRGGHLSLLAHKARHIAVVVAAQSSAITPAYALIKRLAQESGRDGFQVVITRARSEAEAQAIFENLRRTAHDHLGVRLDYLGGSRVPVTDHLADALQSRLPLAPDDLDASGFHSFEALQGRRRSAPALAPKQRESVV